jgi:hypothetical protein
MTPARSAAVSILGLALASFTFGFALRPVVDREACPAAPGPAKTSSVGATGLPGRSGSTGGDLR